MRQPPKKRTRPLTELEGSVLGMIGLQGPCTPYALRREFMDSPSHYWSASSGAVYPLVLRLEKRGLIRVQGKTGDSREGNLYVLTAAGRHALEEWLDTLDAETSISVPPDPLRNRIAFFPLLDARKRRVLIRRAVDALRAYRQRVQAYTELQKSESRVSEYLVSQGALQILEARLEWLLAIGPALEKLDVSTA